MTNLKVPFFSSFIRSQISALVATLADFSSLYYFQENNVFQKLVGSSDTNSLLLSTAVASILGACISFTLGRTWAFKSRDVPIFNQALKYAAASFIIAFINVIGMHILSNLMGNTYIYSKVIIAVITGVLVSFPLFRYWVFK